MHDNPLLKNDTLMFSNFSSFGKEKPLKSVGLLGASGFQRLG